MPQASLLILATAAAMEVDQGVMQVQAAKAQENQLDLQAKANEVKYQQDMLSHMNNLDHVLQTQTVEMSTRGVAFSSPSFNAVQRHTENIAAKQKKSLDLSKSLFDNQIAIEKSNVKNTLYAQLFGDVAKLGLSFAQLAE
ncbi:MAG: hypothetical protein CFE62_006670 [Candidatus Aquirickettsiella gammari]|jgi:hypothetical protein|uniref:Uncharacterized protein n=1 Tax=Candidatus Aquirickettsiella gammari TaxID=2016198 RepID=A0A370CG00_9COXI|nr:MAG: hypothetical protein CFE62_006670 [Candidatus Aquirickettsiella gammari]